MDATPSKPRLSLVGAQQRTLEDRDLSKFAPPSAAAAAAAVVSGVAPSKRTSGLGSSGTPSQKNFLERQEDLLAKTGRANATRSSRTAIPLNPDVGEESADDGVSVAESVSSRFSKAPSVHPSLAGSVCSMACSETTIGAGDDTGYWDFQHRVVEKKDLGQKCRECKQPFKNLGAPLTERRGARISMRYHGECFSGFADPRSQTKSSHHEGHLAGSQLDAAPTNKAGSKMRTSSHFEGGRMGAGLGGKFGSQMGMGHNSFGTKSSKGKPAPVPQRQPGGFTEGELQEHNKRNDRSSLQSIDEADGAE